MNSILAAVTGSLKLLLGAGALCFTAAMPLSLDLALRAMSGLF